MSARRPVLTIAMPCPSCGATAGIRCPGVRFCVDRVAAAVAADDKSFGRRPEADRRNGSGDA